MADYEDEAAVRELELFAMNDSQLYNSRYQPFLKNYAKKIKKGIYDKEKGIGGIERNFVPDIIKKYKKEFGEGSISLGKKDKRELARRITESIEDDAREQ